MKLSILFDLSQVQPEQIAFGINLAIPLYCSSNTGSLQRQLRVEIPHQQWDQAITQGLLSCAKGEHFISFPALALSTEGRQDSFFLHTCRKLVLPAAKVKLIQHSEPTYNGNHFLVSPIKATGRSCVFMYANTTFLKKSESWLAFFSLDDHTFT